MDSLSIASVGEPRALVSAWTRRWLSSRAAFGPLLALCVCAGLVRSFLATRLDGFTIDEAWHVTAGVSYARTLDYRLNPEHPPLVKLWVGAALPESVFHLPEFRPLGDKEGERHFINEAVYLRNDPERVLARARLAMLALHGLLLVGLGLCLRRVFGPALALATIGLTLLDPTVAAHLPLVMTDLPVAVLSACAVAGAYVALRTFRGRDLALAALALGLTLSAKHSGVITGLAVAALSVWMLARGPSRARGRLLLRRSGAVLGMLLGAYALLWGSYCFRFREAPAETYAAALARPGEAEPVLYNRSMADKIGDLRSERQRQALALIDRAELLPRAYLWGLADILRVGMEGREETLYVFGRRVDSGTPWYFFPAVLLAKLPLGLSALALLGAAAALVGRRSPEWRAPLAALAGMAALYLVFLMRGNSGYAGVRHALPVVPVVALLAALGLARALRAERRAARALGLGLLAWSTWSALPVLRPWEYYNELAGGPENAWRNFTDDGLDIRQRTRELHSYYDAHLRGGAQPVYEFYDISEEERQGRRLEFRALSDDAEDSDLLLGTLFVNARWLAPRPIYDFAALREATPRARFGNLMVFEGEYRVPWLRAARRMDRAWEALGAEPPDSELAERLFAEAVELYPEDYGAALELGNLRLGRGAAEPARRAYQVCLEHAPPGELRSTLARQIEALAAGELAGLTPIRNPWLE